MSTSETGYDDQALAGRAVERDTRELLGQTMGFVAVTVGFAALGAYLGRDLSGGAGLLFFIAAFGCIIGLNIAASKGREQLAITLLFGLGLVLGLAVAPVIADYANGDPSALWQAAGATAGFVGACGAYGYATRRDLSSWGRALFWALLALIVFGIVAIFVSIPAEQLIWCIVGLGLFAIFTMYDFQRLKAAHPDDDVWLAASIFVDVLNVFLFMLQLLAMGRD
jgi:FtsH-binding integral membrane protein